MIKSIELGKYLANKYSSYSLTKLLEQFNLEINDFEGSEAEKYILGYYENKEIFLNQTNIKRINNILNLDIKDIVIAHEVFHHIEKIENLSQTYSYDSEVSAHQFVQSFLNLSFNPSIFNEVLKTL